VTITKTRYPIPKDEEARLESLRAYNIMDTPKEAVCDSIVELASQICEAPISMITLIDSDRQWYKEGKPYPTIT
jgi:hypothetical protein